ncbi:Rod binding protein [Arboricoccus pini]|uniref:Rod binding protein n=1 Tax=Arboricoccus pini TaxID=1963835 RepID=A0A212QQJ0_9PROT|nr:hypothetical protein [Arboricoccus pini]SNB61747.1 Rod binding protein [Arboricoccus pini]
MDIKTIAGANPSKTDLSKGQIDKIAHDFESMFIGQLLKAMPSESITGKEAGPYGDLMLDQYGKLISDQGGIGVAKAITRELDRIQKKDFA